MREVKRREFLAGAGIGLIALLADPKLAFSKLQVVDDPLQEYKYTDWEDLYRKEWTWDRVTHGVHSVGCVGNCSWKVFSRKGVVLFEEQTATYPVYSKHTPGKYTYKIMGKDRGEYVRFGMFGAVPSASPAGCQKGNIYSDWMKQGDFLKYPLKQMGERGSRNWKRISWEQGLTEVADKIIDEQVKYPGAQFMCWRTFMITTTTAALRLNALLGGHWIAPSPMVGDGYPGSHTVLIGRSNSTLDDWFTSDLIISWTQNFISQRMPHAHYANEAKYNGARVIVVDCEQSLTSIKADLFLPVRMGSDSYLGAAICNTIIKEKRYDTDYLKEQTDMPMLIRLDTKKFLTQEDMEPDAKGKDMQYYMWDLNTNGPVKAPGCWDSPKEMKTLDITKFNINPALEGVFEIELPTEKVHGIGGPRTIRCTTVLELVKEGLKRYDYDSPLVTEATGLHPSVIRKMIDWIYEAKAMRITNGYNNQRHYDGGQSERLKILVLCLMGHLGTTGSYDETYEGRKHAGVGAMRSPDQPAAPEFGIDKPIPKGRPTTSVPILYEGIYGKSLERSKRYFATTPLKEWIGFDVADMERYMKDAFAKRYQSEIRPPRIYFNFAANYYRSKTNQDWFRKNFLKEVNIYIANDIRMNSTIQDADYIFPCASNYESWDTRETTVVVWDHQLGMPQKPMFEKRSDWDYCVGLCKAIQDRARARGIKPLYLEYWTGTTTIKRTIDMATIYDDFTLNGKIITGEDAMKYAYANSPETLGDERYNTLLKEGYVHVGLKAGSFADYKPDLPYRPWTWQGIDKKPLGTNTGRFQFYIDHEYYLQLDQMTPKPQYSDKWKGGPIKPRRPDGTEYPFSMDYPHTKWGIHSSMRTSEWLLRMQRGDVYIYLNPKVMKEYGIKDADMIRVYNHLGEWFGRAKPKPGLAPYLVYNEHGWEHYMCKNWTHYNNLNCAFYNPLHMAGDARGKGHMVYTGNHTNNRIFYETGVDIENVEGKHLGGGTGIEQR